MSSGRARLWPDTTSGSTSARRSRNIWLIATAVAVPLLYAIRFSRRILRAPPGHRPTRGKDGRKHWSVIVWVPLVRYVDRDFAGERRSDPDDE